MVFFRVHLEMEGFEAEDAFSDVKSAASSKKGKVLATVLLGVVALSVVPLPGSNSGFVAVGSSLNSRQLLQAATATTEAPSEWADFLPVSVHFANKNYALFHQALLIASVLF